MRARRFAPALLASASVLVACPALANANDWNINGTLVNNTGSQAANCFGGTGVGCVATPPGDVVFDDASQVQMPSSPIPNGSHGSFAFQADGFWEGADMYAQYTMPDGSKYEVTAEDDVGSGSGVDGNYAACSQTSAQGSPYVCSAQWAGTYENMSPKYSFVTSASAPVPSAGQSCSGQIAWPSTIDCTATGQFGPTDPNNEMELVFATTTGGVYVKDTANGNNCRPLSGQACAVFTSGAGSDHLIIGTTDTSGTSNAYAVQIIGEADVGDDAPSQMPFWPPGDSSAAAPSIAGLAISPVALNNVCSLIDPRCGAQIAYRDSRNATTVFVLERCATRPSHNARAKCARWVTLPHRTVQSSLTVAGIKDRSVCKLTTHALRRSKRCAWRRQITGQFAHRDHVGRNVIHFAGQIAGRRLPPGLYRLTLVARARSTASFSRPARIVFRIT